MPMPVRQVLNEVGDNLVIKVQLGRTPVEAVLIFFLNLVSLWKFNNKQLQLGYDEIYHNYLLITIRNKHSPTVLSNMLGAEKSAVSSTVYKLEKAQRVRLMKPAYPTEFLDVYDIPLIANKTFTLNRLITSASNIDKHFYTYDAGNNNMCQTFVENIVDINGLTSNIIEEKTRIALKPQNAKALVATLGSRSDIVKRITDLGGALDKLVFDRKIKWKRPVAKEFAALDNIPIRIAVATANNHTEEVLLASSDDTVIVEDMQDTIVENADDVYNAVLQLENSEKKAERNHMIFIVCSVLAVVLMVGAVGTFAFVKWKGRKSKPGLLSELSL
jgi:nitrate reductase NapE component